MSIRILEGGFFAANISDPNCIQELANRVSKGGEGVRFAKRNGAFLCAWNEFEGQGLWESEGGAVAYDLDLANQDELASIVGASKEKALDQGQLLWLLYKKMGVSFIDLLRGAFGFALWDDSEHRLLSATDPYGIRPVVHARISDGVAVASRIRHVLLHPDVPREFDSEAIYLYLFFSAIPSPVTIYKSVRKLEPGKYLLNNNGAVAINTHYDIRYVPDESAGQPHWLKAIPMEVRHAVARTTKSLDSASTGCFLSGGTDSSSIAGFYTEVAGKPVKTFSIGFDEPGYNEMEFAHTAAKRFGTEQHDYYVTPDDVLNLIETLPRLYDEPFGNSSVVPAYYCSKIAKEAGVDAMLAGDGGDEIFGGNERYVKNLVFEKYGKIPFLARKGILEPLLAALPGIGAIHKAKRYVRRASMPNPRRFYSYNLLAETNPAEIFNVEFLAQVDPECFLTLAQRHYDNAAPAPDTDRLLYLDMKFTITDNDLRKVTQMGEAAGVRIKYPLLDRELVDFAATIPPDLLVKPGFNRYIFKQAMQGFLPDEIIQKSKHGFGLPIAPWFRKNKGLSAMLGDFLFTSDARMTQWLRPEFLQSMRKNFEADDTGFFGSNFWVFLMLEMWLRELPGAA